MCAEDYIHRIGRTGRASETGRAYSFSLSKDFKKVSEIEKLLSKKIDRATIEGLEPKRKEQSLENANKNQKRNSKDNFKNKSKRNFKRPFNKFNKSKNKFSKPKKS
jgi:ATP-dependent RNA helicase RhlE